jgi:hypothetical protein
MKVTVKGVGDVNLTQNHFRAAGGQASVYVYQGQAFKIYTDPANAIPDAKFQILKVIADDHVIKPESILLDSKKVPIGYTMKEVPSKHTLGHLFTKTFRDRNKVSQDNIVTVSAKIWEHVPHIHAAKALMIDFNAMNVLIPDTWDDAYFIDVDSYQVAGYPATFLSPLIRDYSVKSSDGWSELSDWYSYAVLMFQLYTRVHPYGGNHPLTDGMPSQDQMEYRMRNNISAFRTGARLPGCALPFDVIPSNFKDWLKAVLEDGKRLPPPDPRGGPAAVIFTGPMVPLVVTGGNLVISDIFDYEEWTLLQYAESNGSTLALITKDGRSRLLHNGQCIFEGATIPGETLIGFTPKKNLPVGLNSYQKKLTFFNYSARKSEVLEINANDLAKSGDRFYVRNGSRVLEVEFSELANTCLVSASHCVADVLEQASDLYEGVVIQSMIGSIYISLFPQSHRGYQVRVPELDKYKVLEAKFEGGVLMVVGEQAGKYDRLIFRFDPDYLTYDLRKVEDIALTGLNFITLASGVCIVITEEDKLEAFSASKGSKSVKVVDDPAIGNDMRLMIANGRAAFERGHKIYGLSLK